MNAWLCPSEKYCPFVGKPFCGHSMTNPVILSYHAPPLTTQECYVAHAINCWKEWNKLKNRWLNPIKRIAETVSGLQFHEDDFQGIMGLLILHHDIGKLAKEYQTGDFFRHEVLSAYILYNQLIEWGQNRGEGDLLAPILASAIYLHHEGLQISHEHFEMREPTYSYLLNWLSSKEFHLTEYLEELANQLNRHFVQGSINPFTSLKDNRIVGKEVADTLGAIMITVDGCAEPLAVRMGVAAVLHPLTICDNLAANLRGGAPSRISRALMEFFSKGAISEGEE